MSVRVDNSASFVAAVSLIAALEGAVGHPGHRAALPYLGLARAELVDFGQRLPGRLVDIVIDDFGAGLVELERRLSTLLTASSTLPEALRVDAAQQLARHARSVTHQVQ